MNSMLKRIAFAREGSYVERNHTTPAINGPIYTVGFHQSNMTQMAFILFEDCLDILTMPLIRAINFHDAASEQITGDVVGEAKLQHPPLAEALREIEDQLQKKWQLMPAYLTEEEKLALHFLDIFELYIYCLEQMAMGNRSPRLIRMYRRVEDRCNQMVRELRPHLTPDAEYQISTVMSDLASYYLQWSKL